jgi:hypothetical protein
MSECIVDTFGIVQDFADLHGDMSTPLYQAIMDVMVSRQREEIVRCRDCKHANISSFGFCKYCEKFVLPDQDGYGPDPKVNLPLDFFCAYGERRES